MEDSVPNDHGVCDSNKGDEVVASCEPVEKIQPELSSVVDEPIDKSSYLSAFPSIFNSEDGDKNGLLCVDLHENENDNEQRSCETNIPEQNPASSDEKHELNTIVSSSTSYDCVNMCSDDFVHGFDRRTTISMLGETSIIAFQDQKGCFDSDERMVHVTCEAKDWTMTSRSLSSENSENEDCAEYPLPESCYISFGNMDMNVIIFPDYVMYGETLYTETQVAFSVESIKFECSDSNGLMDKLVTEWFHSDVVYLGCQWSASVDAALVKLCVRVNDTIKIDKTQNNPENVQIIFSVTEANWAATEQRILNLSERYKEMWNSYSSDDTMWNGDDIGSNVTISREYLSNIAVPFEEVIYPKGDPDAVSISKRDVELLEPETFINDTIIDFYIKFLQNKIPPNKKQRFHFFNSFFFRKLADLDKERGNISEGRSAFLRVRKWTRKVNIFEKDYIFIPVNFNLHWSLLVICNPGEEAKIKDGDAKSFLKLPCVLHMDSIKGTHSGVKSIIQSYIWEEWKERNPESLENDSTNLSSIRFVPLELPQQENLFDCGLFLLHYVELFLEEAPFDFNPLKISKFCTFLTADWFQPSEASLKRSVIWNLIYKLLNDPTQQAIPPFCNNGELSSLANGDHDVVNGLMLESHSGQPTAHVKQVTDDSNFCGMGKCDEHSKVVLQEFLKQGAPVVSPTQYIKHADSADLPHPEIAPASYIFTDVACASEQFVFTNVGGECDHSLDQQVIAEPYVISPSHKEVGLECTGEGAEQNLLHDTSHMKEVDNQGDESLEAAAAANSGLVAGLSASICQTHIDNNRESQVNKETKLEIVDSRGSSIDHTDIEDEEGYCISIKISATTENSGKEAASSVAAVDDNYDFDADPNALICHKLSINVNDSIENDEIKSTGGDACGFQRTSDDKEDEEDHHISCKTPDIAENSGKEDESLVVALADNSEFATDLSVSILQKKLSGDNKESQENNEGNSAVEGNYDISSKAAETAEASSKNNKDVQMVDTVIQFGSDDKIDPISEHFQEECISQLAAKEQGCQEIVEDEFKTEDCSGQKYTSQIAAVGGDASSEVQLPNKRRKVLEVYNRRTTRSNARILDN